MYYFQIQGPVAQTFVGAKWIARTPPKRQVEGSNPSGPVSNMSITQHISMWYAFSEVHY